MVQQEPIAHPPVAEQAAQSGRGANMLRVGVLQTHVSASKDESMRLVARAIRQAAHQGAQMWDPSPPLTVTPHCTSHILQRPGHMLWLLWGGRGLRTTMRPNVRGSWCRNPLPQPQGSCAPLTRPCATHERGAQSGRSRPRQGQWTFWASSGLLLSCNRVASVGAESRFMVQNVPSSATPCRHGQNSRPPP